MAQLAATKKARRRSQPLPAREFAYPEEGAGAAANAREKGEGKEKGKGKRERRLSLGLLTIGRASTGTSTPSPPPPLPSGTASAGASHYIPHSQTPAGRVSAESTRAAHAHIKTVAHRHSADVSAPAKLQKKTRPGHARTQSATSISSSSSFTAGCVPGLNSGFGGVVPPSSFTQHRGRLSADMDSRRTWTPSPSPTRANSLPLLSTFGSSHRDSAAAPHALLSESPSTLKPGFLQSAHASGIALALTEAEALLLARSAAEILGLHEQLVKQLDEALQQVHFELPDSAENVEEAVKVVCRIFAAEVSSLVHFSTSGRPNPRLICYVRSIS